MHVSIILAGASIAILAFTGKKTAPGSQIYGLIMLPVAVCFIVYSMFQCKLLECIGCDIEVVLSCGHLSLIICNSIIYQTPDEPT